MGQLIQLERKHEGTGFDVTLEVALPQGGPMDFVVLVRYGPGDKPSPDLIALALRSAAEEVLSSPGHEMP